MSSDDDEAANRANTTTGANPVVITRPSGRVLSILDVWGQTPPKPTAEPTTIESSCDSSSDEELYYSCRAPTPLTEDGTTDWNVIIAQSNTISEAKSEARRLAGKKPHKPKLQPRIRR